MNEDVKTLWVSALNSGLPQTEGRLQDEVGFCCLGVLCDLAVKAGVIGGPKVFGLSKVRGFPAWEGGQFYYEEALLPAEVMKWAGLFERNPSVEESGRRATLSELNDAGTPFPEIAELIKEQL